MEKNNVWKKLESEIEKIEMLDSVKRVIFSNIMTIKNHKINMLITGATGSGKSSTINALFDCEVAKVGEGVNPETMDIRRYDLDNLILWDSPGLGDGIEQDKFHVENIVKKLNEKDKNGDALIDIVLVIVDGSSRDMGTSYELINNVIIPHLDDKSRILVAINQCDVAMKGKNWDHEKSKPNSELEKFLNEKVESVQRRVANSTGVEIEPIVYSATESYNLSKLLYFILQHTPKKKRMVYIDKLQPEDEIFTVDDGKEDYKEKTKESFMDSFMDGITTGADLGGSIGKALGPIGEAVGNLIGGAVGGFFGAINGFFSSIFG